MHYEENQSKFKFLVKRLIFAIFGRYYSKFYYYYQKIIIFFNLLINRLVSFFFRFRNQQISLNYNLSQGKNLSFDFEKTKSILKENGMDFFDRELSWHFHIFANFATDKSLQILEIGTNRGSTANFLSKIFINSKITTLDLPDIDFSSEISGNIHKVPVGGQILSNSIPNLDTQKILEVSEEFINLRSKNLNKGNIVFIQKDSLLLMDMFEKRSFDFIWVDGDHVAPQVSFDILQALHLCKKGGYILVDDVIKHGGNQTTTSYHSHKIIQNLTRRKFIKSEYFYKRLILSNSSLKKQYFISLIQKDF